MYWSRTGSYIDLLLWLLISLLTWAGGWLIATFLFRLRPRERLLAGLAIGLLLFTLFCNLFAQVVPFPAACWTAAVLILLGGIVFAWRSDQAIRFPWREILDWKQILAFGAGGLIFLGINRGLALFEDYSNLPLISMIATGDVPPHFYLNPGLISYYHYGLLLLSAGLMRVGGFFPWSALDVYKALSLGLTVALGILWYRRLMSWKIAMLFAGGLIAFAGGARWLLLLLPESLLHSLSAQVHMIGSAAANAPDFYTALISPWSAQGEGPISFPFAFVNSFIQPLVMSLGSSGAFPLVILFLLLLLHRRHWEPAAAIVYGLILAVMALFAEAYFAMGWGGLLLAILLRSWSKRSIRPALEWVWVLLPGAVLVPLMGGLLSAPLQLLLGKVSSNASQGLVYLPGISLRWPPAILSGHLGELSMSQPGNLLIILAEMGPVLLLAPVVLLATRAYLRSGKLYMAGLSLTAIASFLAPIFISFTERDRDTSRLISSALQVWLILGLPYIWIIYQRGREGVRALLTGLYAISIFSGVVLFALQLIAIPKTQLSYFIQAPDAQMSRLYWNRLKPGAWMLDPAHPYRPATLFGRTTGPAFPNLYTPTQEFIGLISRLDPVEISNAGYAYLYLDRKTWQGLASGPRQAIQSKCVRLVDEQKTELGDFRRLYDITRCKTGP